VFIVIIIEDLHHKYYWLRFSH